MGMPCTWPRPVFKMPLSCDERLLIVCVALARDCQWERDQRSEMEEPLSCIYSPSTGTSIDDRRVYCIHDCMQFIRVHRRDGPGTRQPVTADAPVAVAVAQRPSGAVRATSAPAARHAQRRPALELPRLAASGRGLATADSAHQGTLNRCNDATSTSIGRSVGSPAPRRSPAPLRLAARL
jgi:hypothetical protein